MRTAAHDSRRGGPGGSVLGRLWKAFAGDGRADRADETQPIPIAELVEDETNRLLELAGLPPGDHELRFVAPGQHSGRGSEEWLVFVRLRRWHGGTDWIMVGLEKELQQRMESAGIQVRAAVYWRVLPEARTDRAQRNRLISLDRELTPNTSSRPEM